MVALELRGVVGSPNVGYHWEHLVLVPWRQMFELVGVGLLGNQFYLLHQFWSVGGYPSHPNEIYGNNDNHRLLYELSKI